MRAEAIALVPLVTVFEHPTPIKSSAPTIPAQLRCTDFSNASAGVMWGAIAFGILGARFGRCNPSALAMRGGCKEADTRQMG